MANLREHIRQSSGYKWWILGMIMLGTFMAVLDVTVVNVGLPAIMSAFGIGISSAEWVITAYMITMTIMLPSAGWFADRFGNSRVTIASPSACMMPLPTPCKARAPIRNGSLEALPQSHEPMRTAGTRYST